MYRGAFNAAIRDIAHSCAVAGQTPRESMPELVQYIMLVAPTTHYVMLAQAILYRGAGIEAVWPNFVGLAAIGGALFAFSLGRLRKSLSEIR